MPTLTILKNRRVDREYSFTKDTVFIGREDGNDLVLEDASVSRVHAKFQRDSAGWLACDLNSTNGIFVNNTLVKEAPVKDGDVIILGDYTFFVRMKSDENAKASAAVSGSENARQLLEGLCRLSERFSGEITYREMLEAMTDALLSIFQAQRAFVLTRDDATGYLGDPLVVRRSDTDDGRIHISKTVANRVMEEKHPILITDVEADQQFRGVTSIASEQVRSIICAPLLGADSAPTGVVYLDSRVAARTFTQQDLLLLDRFLVHASQMIRTSAAKDRLFAANENLSALAKDISLADYDTERIVGESAALKAVHAQVRDVSSSDVSVFLTGESGTGKELIAKAIHYASKRSGKPFVAVNCMALAPDLIESELFGHEKGAFTGATARKIGKFEQADGGTIFLDEIGELSLPIQIKLLRVLQERTICRVGGSAEVKLDLRLVSATNRDLSDAIPKGQFREDLFYRINVFNITLPPLRERKGDIPALAQYFVGLFNSRMGRNLQGLEPATIDALTRYDWPGNIRELRNVIERAFVVEKGRAISPASLPFAIANARSAENLQKGPVDYPPDFDEARDLFEKDFIIQSLKRHEGNITLTSKETGLPRRTLYRRLEKFGIDPKELLSEESIRDFAKKD